MIKFWLVKNTNRGEGESVNIKVYDATGRLVQEQKLIATGFVQKTPIDLKSAGLYLLEVQTTGQLKAFKLLKQ